jgi:hypothetical protein
MRWAYSGSMRPEFKVLACEAFRAELCVNFVYCNQRVAFGHDFVIWTARLQPCKALGSHVKAAFDY